MTEAFRYMQKGVHIGKVIIRMPEKHDEIQAAGRTKPVTFSDKSSYLLVGGLGGLGRAIATWMVECGARNLIFLSRSAGKSSQDQAFLHELQSQGCHAIAVAGSVTDMADVQMAVQSAQKPLAGVLQMSMVLKVRINLMDNSIEGNNANSN